MAGEEEKAVSSTVPTVAVAPAAIATPPEGETPVPQEDVPAVEAAASPPKPRRVLVIDDELDGLTAAHLRQWAPAFASELGDLTSPTTMAVWEFVAPGFGFKSFDQTEPDVIQAFLSSEAFVRETVLSGAFRKANIPESDKLADFYERAKSITQLKNDLEAAYAAPAFDLTFESARPSAHQKLMEYDLVVLDLVLANSAAAVDELVSYLKKLAEETYPKPLPCLIVMSSREEMVEHRLRFSTESSISAAGVLLLEKRHVSQAQFGAPGLILCYQQLDRQREVAQDMRVFVLEWMKALKNAMNEAATTLWNLDAAALQEIHLSAYHDDDPYDEHLNELVAREYIWHVERSQAVSAAIESLDKCFYDKLQTVNEKLVISERFMAPFVDSKPARDIVSHYTWTGFPLLIPDSKDPTADLLARFNRLMPFGAVLAPETITNNAECWVHITQQCDLNSAVRNKKPGTPTQSVMFAGVTAMEVSDRTVPNHKTDQLVARGLRVGAKEFDLRLIKNRLISVPIPTVPKLLSDNKMQVVGRIRHDIAHQFLSATANHMTRPAQLKTTRIEVHRCKIYIWAAGLPDNRPLAFRDAEEREERIVSISRHNDLYYFQDDTSQWLALWITGQLAAHFQKSNLEIAQVCNRVRTGIRDNQAVVSVLNLKVETCALDQIHTYWKGKALPNSPSLYVFLEPEAPR